MDINVKDCRLRCYGSIKGYKDTNYGLFLKLNYSIFNSQKKPLNQKIMQDCKALQITSVHHNHKFALPRRSVR